MGKTPAQEFDEAAKRAVVRMRNYRTALTVAERRKEAVDQSTIELRDIVEAALGYGTDDVVIDEFDNLYRVTKVYLPSFYLTSSSKSTRRDIGSFTAAMNQVSVQGLLLNESGVPTWTKDRTIRGKLSRYQP